MNRRSIAILCAAFLVIAAVIVAFTAARSPAQPITPPIAGPRGYQLGIEPRAGITVSNGRLLGPRDKVEPLERVLKNAGTLRVEYSGTTSRTYIIAVTLPGDTKIDTVRDELKKLGFVSYFEEFQQLRLP